MSIKQISIFLENRRGRLADVTRILTESKINMRALSLADTADFGVLRIIVDEQERCLGVLHDNDFIAQETDVIAVEVPDEPGGLYGILSLFDRNDVNIEYMYAFVEKKMDRAAVIFKIDDHEKAKDVLGKSNINVLTRDIIEGV
jgi:hypothetical protein